MYKCYCDKQENVTVRNIKYLFIISSIIVFVSCIEDDIVNDRVDERISFDNPISEINITESHRFEPRFTNNIGDTVNADLIWSSSDETILTVDQTGAIEAVGVGNAILTVIALDNDNAELARIEVKITVNPLEETLTINNVIEVLIVGNVHRYQTTYKNELGQIVDLDVNWVSSNNNISVTTQGEIIANSIGGALITASVTTSNGKVITAEDEVIVSGVQETLSINNPILELDLNGTKTHQYTTTYTDQNGQVGSPQVNWTSSDSNIASVSSSGFVTALQEGEVTITASVTGNNGNITSEDEITVINTSSVIVKTGTLSGSYSLRGTFSIREVDNSNNLELVLNDDYNLSDQVPGPYLYLSNNTNTINGALEIGRVTTFSGGHKYIIPNTGINEFRYVLYWCKPFSVRIGHGEIED